MMKGSSKVVHVHIVVAAHKVIMIMMMGATDC